MFVRVAALLALIIAPLIVLAIPPPQTQPVDIRSVSNYVLVRKSSAPFSSSALWQINVSAPSTESRAGREALNNILYKYNYGPSLNASSQQDSPQTTVQPDYINAPYLMLLSGNRTMIGWDYADLLGQESAKTFTSFINKLTAHNETIIFALDAFLEWLWESFYERHVPAKFLEELRGMKQWCHDRRAQCDAISLYGPPPDVVSRRFFVLANMPADAPNIIAGVERELEEGWPEWLKDIVNELVDWLEKHFIHSCDAYGVWGSRTEKGRLYTSRNLDFNSDTGINSYKLVTSFNITDGSARVNQYATIGFAFGLGALAGLNEAGITTSEMNLDNSQVTFSGLPFPLRLRYVLEGAVDLNSAMTLWNSTNNTNSFNFLIGSAKDQAAYALETMFNYTGQFPANSPIEAAATYDCGYPPNDDPTCRGWVWQPQHHYGKVPIGFPLREAVWRSNHGMNPKIMATQEPLFNDTVFRYRLMHDLFNDYNTTRNEIRDLDAVNIVASLGIKGTNFLTCDQKLTGSNIMSIVYVPGEHRLFVAWERGSGKGQPNGTWRPAGCAPYVAIPLAELWGKK